MICEYCFDQIKSSRIVNGVLALEKRTGKAVASSAERSEVLGVIGPVFARFDMFSKLRDESVIVSLFSVLFRWLLTAVREVYGSFTRIWPLRWAAKLADALIKLHLSDIYAIMVALILCIYHDNWNNGYMLIAALLAGALYLLKLVKMPHRPDRRLPVSLYVFMAAVAAVVPFGLSLTASLKIYSYYVTSFIFMACFAGSIRDLDDLRRALAIIYLAVLYNSIFSIIQSYYGVAVNLSYTDVTNNPESVGRVYANFYNPNNFAEILLLMTPACFIALMSSKRLTNNAKIITGLTFVLPVAALLLTYSRSSWISFAIFAASFVGLYNPALIPIMVLAFIAAIPIIPQSIKNRFMSLFTGKDSSMQYRLYIWEGVTKTIKANPITGHGLGSDNFYNAYQTYMNTNAVVAMHSHNLFLELWMESGIAGLVTFLVFYASTLKNSLLIAFRERREMKYYAVALFSTLFGIIFVEMVEYIWYYPRVMLCFWSAVGFVWALVRIAVRNRSHAVK